MGCEFRIRLAQVAVGRLREAGFSSLIADTAQKRFRSRLRLDLNRFPNRPKLSGTFLSGLDENARRAEVLGRRPSFLSTNAFIDLEDSEPEPEFEILRFAESHRHEEDCEGAEPSWIVTRTQIFPIV